MKLFKLIITRREELLSMLMKLTQVGLNFWLAISLRNE